METRAVMHKLLRKYGFNTKTKTGVIIVEGAQEFCDDLKSQMTNGELGLTLTNQLNIVFFNVVWTILTGKKVGSNDPNTLRLMAAMDRYIKAGKFGGGLATLFPELIKIFPRVTGFTALKHTGTEWRKALQVRSTSNYIQFSTLGYIGKSQVHLEEFKETAQNPNIEEDNLLNDFLQKVMSTEKPKNLLDTIYTGWFSDDFNFQSIMY